MYSMLVQLDANLIEEEPYNRLAWKIKRRLKWRDKIQIYQKCGKPVSKPAKMCRALSGVVNTQIFSRSMSLELL